MDIQLFELVELSASELASIDGGMGVHGSYEPPPGFPPPYLPTFPIE